MRRAILILSLIGMAGCSNPYSPTQRAVGGGLLGGAGGAAIGGTRGRREGRSHGRRIGCCWWRGGRRGDHSTAHIQVVQQR